MARTVTFATKSDPWASYAKNESRAKKQIAKYRAKSGKGGGGKKSGKGGGS